MARYHVTIGKQCLYTPYSERNLIYNYISLSCLTCNLKLNTIDCRDLFTCNVSCRSPI